VKTEGADFHTLQTWGVLELANVSW